MIISYFPVIATEIEFYLFDSGRNDSRRNSDMEKFWQIARQEMVDSRIDIFKIEQEKGCEQYEISLCHSRDIEKIISDTNQLKKIISDLANSFDMKADFSAKPLADDYGSGLHVHIHLEDENGNNLYWKKDDKMSDMLAHSIAGLLATLPENMNIFAPTDNSRKRFVQGSNAPLTLSWGANNRSCAIRLPDKQWNNKHIEHRVSGADADVGDVIKAIISGINYGIKNRLMPPAQIYGDASLAMYELPKLVSE